MASTPLTPKQVLQPPSQCQTPGCKGVATRGFSYCDDCRKPKPEEAKVEKHDYHREWAYLYHDKRWRHPKTGLRAATLRRDIMCVVCKRRASTVADHAKDHRGDPKLFFDPKNVRGVCAPCHDEKTGSEHGSGDRQPPQPGLVAGKVVEYAPALDQQPKEGLRDPNFDFAAALRRKT